MVVKGREVGRVVKGLGVRMEKWLSVVFKDVQHPETSEGCEW